MEKKGWGRALSSGKTSASVATLWIFMAAFTLDDLHLVRIPILYVGLVLAVATFAFAPPLFAARLLRRTLADHPHELAERLDAALVRRRFALGVSAAALVVWLAIFAAGVTPRW